MDEIQAKFNKENNRRICGEHRNQLRLGDSHDPSITKYLETVNGANSAAVRISTPVRRMKHTLVAFKTEVVTSCFKMTFKGTSCIYAYIHSRVTEKGSTEHAFYCASAAFRSQDGEFRGRVLPWEQFLRLFEHYPEILEVAEEVVCDRLASGELTFQVDFFFPKNFGQTSQETFENNMRDGRLPIKLLQLAWLSDIYSINDKTVENHINPAYQWIIHKLGGLKPCQWLIENHGKTYAVMRRHLSEFAKDFKTPLRSLQRLIAGQKIMPLAVSEASRPDDINFGVWREIYANTLVSNMVLNFITASFPVVNNWFYIQNAHAGIFDNIAQHERYDHSEIAGKISGRMRELNKMTYVDDDPAQGSRSDKFERLSRQIRKSIVAADANIALTDLAACMTIEYVGRTLRDLSITTASPEASYGLSLIFTDSDFLSRYVFEYLFAFYCMNTKVGVIHGDLHLNNATLFQLFEFRRDGKILIDPVNYTRVAWILGDDVYLFKGAGIYAAIIDFSRAILGDYAGLAHDFSPNFAEMYLANQRYRIMATLNHHLPAIMQSHAAKIEILLADKFPLMFKIITAIDAYVLFSNMLGLFTSEPNITTGVLKAPEESVSLLRKISKEAEESLTHNLLAALEGRINEPNDIEWPNLLLLKKFFAGNILTPDTIPPEGTELLDIFNGNNDIIYELTDVEKFGPILSAEPSRKLWADMGIPPEKDFDDWDRYKFDVGDVRGELPEDPEDVYEPWMLM